MSARGSGIFLGSVVAGVVIVAVAGWAAAFFYCAGIVIGPSVYLHKAPWNL